jgi:hypothetical protein
MPIRVLICGMPRLLTDVVSGIVAAEPDMVVVARLDGAAEPSASVRALEPDVIILQQEGAPKQGDHSSLFAAREGLKIVAIGGGGRGGTLYRKGAEPTTLGRLSAARLLRTVRGGAPPRTGGPQRRRRPERSGR